MKNDRKRFFQIWLSFFQLVRCLKKAFRIKLINDYWVGTVLCNVGKLSVVQWSLIVCTCYIKHAWKFLFINMCVVYVLVQCVRSVCVFVVVF